MIEFGGLLRRRARPNSEEGVALPMVIGTGMIMLLLVTTALSTSVSGLVKASGDQNWNAAGSAAYAGVEEYESRLANDNAYMIYGNGAAPFSSTSTLSLPTGTLTNPAFGIGQSGSWASVPGSDGRASYRYEVDTSNYSSSGILRIRSTGRVGNATRTVVANLKQQGFIDFLYFTDYEIADPDQNGDDVATCEKYAWEGRPLPNPPYSQCSDIAFGNGDVINGPMHSNDTIRACDATFNGIVTTSNNPASGLRYLKRDSNGYSCSGQVFTKGNPTYSPKVGMPQTNSEMKNETRSDLPISVVAVPGCLYTGPTSITLTNNGKMTVRSPWSIKTNVSGDPATSGTTPAVCGTPGNVTNGLGSSSGATIPVLDRNLIFVQNVPTTAGDPNRRPTSGSGSLPDGYSSSTCGAGNGIGFPTTNEYVASIASSYGCRNGDIFVKGALSGAMTLAAENYVYVTGDITYTTPLDDVLGLVGQNAVWVWNPVRYSSGSYSSLLSNNRTINAAILSVAHTFQVQNYDRGGGQGTLTVNGAISQKFRGIVRSGSNGYTKAYSYDARFRYIAPPKFLSPVSTTYGVNVIVDVKPAFTAAGASIP
ncbi:hypothetical protein [Cryobacterium cryoconiti]|uniref:Type 4 fimbrial biogenesis protein PilX N-terminal domain-containing protein n=1 Tax=Cryobacterium cryoconiti TaxID=1259239 RepID=A0A4Y8JX58_9MICO|nr:hypothetical protein [Cryobacterium cryoconiti]TFD30595.1 hypothetical protein E3T49_07840 [Cryobacterium cryoconiti]